MTKANPNNGNETKSDIFPWDIFNPFYDERFLRYRFGTILGLLDPILAKKWVSPIFQPDHQVNPENRPSKDSKTAAVSEFAKIGRSHPFLDWPIKDSSSKRSNPKDKDTGWSELFIYLVFMLSCEIPNYRHKWFVQNQSFVINNQGIWVYSLSDINFIWLKSFKQVEGKNCEQKWAVVLSW